MTRPMAPEKRKIAHAPPRFPWRGAEGVLHLLLSEYLALAVSMAWFLAVLPFTPGFASWENLGNVLSSMLPLLVLAVG